ncbi:MAG: hypothetical protein ABR915_17225 [Thermoguttaceae bacterium]
MPRLAALLLIAGIAIAANAQQPDLAQVRAKELKAGIKTFRLTLNYNGDEDKPFYRLILSVPPIGYDRNNPFYRLAQLSEEQASKIIDHLAQDGFLEKAADQRSKQKRPPPTMPGYTLTVGDFHQDLGWGLPMLKRLDGLRKVLDGDAAKGMDFLLGRLSGLRQQWEKEEKAKKPDPNEDYARYVHVGVIDPKQAGSVGKLLEDHGIPNIIEGSVAYGVSVPPEKKEGALELLKADAAKRNYWFKLPGE